MRHRGQKFRSAPLAKHLDYLKREGVTKDDRDAAMFHKAHDQADDRAFAASTEDDRHHFRFIVSPEDAGQMEDLHAFTRDLIRPMAETLAALGSEKAWLVHGSDGTDELTITGVSWIAALEDGTVTDMELHPEEAGLPVHPFEAILGGTPEENGVAFRALLDGAPGAYRDAVLLNAAAALVVADKVTSLSAGVEMAKESLDSGAAKAKIEALARITSEAEIGRATSREKE